MYPKKRKNLFAKIFFNQKFLSLLGIIIFILVSMPVVKNIKQRQGVDREILELKEEIESVEGKNKDLQKLISYLDSEQFTEEQARLNFGLKKEGEQVVVIETGEKNNNTNNKTVFNIPGLDKAKPPKKITNPQKWFKYFFDK